MFKSTTTFFSFVLLFISCSQETILIEPQYYEGLTHSYQISMHLESEHTTIGIEIKHQKKVEKKNNTLYLTETNEIEEAWVDNGVEKSDIAPAVLDQLQNGFTLPTNRSSPIADIISRDSNSFDQAQQLFSGAGISSTVDSLSSMNFTLGQEIEKSVELDAPLSGTLNTNTTLMEIEEDFVIVSIQANGGYVLPNNDVYRIIADYSIEIDREIYWPIRIRGELRSIKRDDSIQIVTIKMVRDH